MEYSTRNDISDMSGSKQAGFGVRVQNTNSGYKGFLSTLP